MSRERHIPRDLTMTQRLHERSMEQGSALLRHAVLRHLREREERLQALTRRNEEARRSIRRGVRPDIVREAFGLSRTAYEQLAGQVRA